MVSYADFMTLLFAFFVVLYSSSQVDKAQMVKPLQRHHRRLSAARRRCRTGRSSVVIPGTTPAAHHPARPAREHRIHPPQT